MYELLKAMVDHYNASEIAGSCPIYEHPAPMTAEMPYVTYQVVSSPPVGISADGWGEDVLVQFDVWSKDLYSAAECTQLRDLFCKAFNNDPVTGTPLFISIDSHVETRPIYINSHRTDDPDRGKRYMIQYRFTLQRTSY